MTNPVAEGMLAAQARISQLQALVGARPASAGGGAFGALLSAASSSLSTSSLDGATFSTAGGAVSGDDIVSLATQQLGTPYVWGAEDPASGFDCSGLVQYVYGQAGIDLPRVSADQAKVGEKVASLADALPGDLVAFGSPVDHIGIYAGDGKMVVAPHRGDVVKVQDITSTPTAIRRVLGTSAAAPSLGASSTGTSFDQLFQQAGAKYGVSPSLHASVARAETGLHPRAVTTAGARGLMQLMPATASSLGVDAFDPAQAVDGAARLLKSNLDTFGSTELAVAAYNAGPAAVRRYGGVPPFSETQTYVRRVLAGMGGN
jgi:cell wall-associated NlpC family hydrolase